MPGLKGSFLIAVLAGAAAVIGWATYHHVAHPLPLGAIPMRRLANNVWVSEQISPSQLRQLRGQQFGAVVDLRPDGEVANQPSSNAMAQAAGEAGLAFTYDPVPHGDVPDSAVTGLQRALVSQHQSVLLYCRSGRRAARTWALAEASTVGGMDAASIKDAVRRVGQSVDDLQIQIDDRIAARPSSG